MEFFDFFDAREFTTGEMTIGELDEDEEDDEEELSEILIFFLAGLCFSAEVIVISEIGCCLIGDKIIAEDEDEDEEDDEEDDGDRNISETAISSI